MSLTTAPLKVKITREDGTSELRRLGFSFDNSMVARGRFGGQVQAEGYHLALCKFLLRSLHDLYPDLPVAQFSELIAFSVKDEDGDMVRFESEEEFVAALPDYQSWKTCLRVEATVLKPSVAPSPRNPITSTPTPVDDPASPSAATIAAALGSIGVMPAVSTSSFVGAGRDEPTPSESGSTISFMSNMSSSALSGSGLSSPSPLSAAAAVAEASAAATEVAAAVAANREGCFAPPSVSGTEGSTTVTASPTGPSGSTAKSATGADGNPPAAPAGGNGTGTSPDAATPAKAFLTQVLPGLADVLARSIYAAQWAPEMMPTRAPTQAQAQEVSRGQAQGQAQGASPPSDPTAAATVSAAAATAASEAATAAGAAATKAATDAAAAAAGAAATAAATQAAAARAAEVAAFPSPVSARITSGDPREEGASAAMTAESDAPIAVHVGVVCDVCDMSPITGTRYKCAVRSDFDLCEGCERTAGSASPFPYLKIRTPAQAPAAIVCLLKPDQPRSVKEANAQQVKKKGARGESTGAAGAGGPAGKSYAAGQAWRARRDPQHGGWGEGRRNTARWMRDVARHQHYQQQIGGAPSSGIGCFPTGVEVVRNGTGGPVWRGPRMQRRNLPATAPSWTSPGGGKDPEAKAAPAEKVEAANRGEKGTQEGSAPAADPARATKSVVEHDGAGVGAAGEGAAPEDTAPVVDPVIATTATEATLLGSDAEGGQTSDYQDMLAASMRSLASSMTASLPTSSGAQDGGKGKGGVTAAGSGGRPQAKPMARFVTDVSVADGSPLPPNTRFVKTWCMRNDGAVTFPVGCRLMPVSGDLMAGPEDGVAVDQRAPGEEFHVSATMTTPPLSGRYIGYWRLRTADGQNFGHRIWADVLVTGGTADLVVEGSMDGDWDLVNMQRLSKAVEDTAKDQQNAADDAASVAAASAPASTPTPTRTPDVTPDTPVETPVETSESTPAATATPADITETAREDDDGLAEAIAAIEAATVQSSPVDAGSEETKSSDGAEVRDEKVDGEAAVAAMKWHRELCSLAEMGFGDTPRNISLLEKHVTTSGGSGMERVLHELLSWHEVSFQ